MRERCRGVVLLRSVALLTAVGSTLWACLWSKQELARGDIISEAESIQPRTFEASFWSVAEAERAAASAGKQ